MIPSKKNRFIGKLFSLYHNRLMRKHFFAVHLKGLNNLIELNTNKPVLLFANHSNWWDGFTAYLLTNRLLKKDDYLMMDIEQMKKYSFFKYVGVFSVNRNNAKEALSTLNYATELLKESGKFLWMFPEGLMNPQDKRPLKFFSGITKIAEKLNNVYIVPVCFRYEYLMEQRPEIFISAGKPFNYENGLETDKLRKILEEQLDSLKNDVISGNTGDYKTIFKGKSSRNKTFD